MPTRFRATCAALLAVSAVAVFGVTHAAATAASYSCSSIAEYKPSSGGTAFTAYGSGDVTIGDISGDTVAIKKGSSACEFTFMRVKIDFAIITTTDKRVVTANVEGAKFYAANLGLTAAAGTSPVIVSITGTTFTATTADNVMKTYIYVDGTFAAKSTFTLTGNTFDLTADDTATYSLSIGSLSMYASFGAGLTFSVAGNAFSAIFSSSTADATAISYVRHISFTFPTGLDDAKLDFKNNTYVIELNGMTCGPTPASTTIAPININTDSKTITNSEINLFGGGDTVKVSIHGATDLGASDTLRVAGLAYIDATLGAGTNLLVAGPGVDASLLVASDTLFTKTDSSTPVFFFGMFRFWESRGGSLVLAAGTEANPVTSRISCEGAKCGKRDTSETFAYIENVVTFTGTSDMSASYLTHAVLNADTTVSGDATDLIILKTAVTVTLAGNNNTGLDFSYVKGIASSTKLTTESAMPALTALTYADKTPALKLWFAVSTPAPTTGTANLLVCHCQFQGKEPTDQKTLIDSDIVDTYGIAFPSCDGDDTKPKTDGDKGSGVTASGAHLGLIVGLCVVALVVG